MQADGRRALALADIAALADALRGDGQPERICGAVEAVSAQAIGHRLFTVMRFDQARNEVERIHSSLPAAYPVGGRKTKRDTPWADHVLREHRVFRANDADGIRAAFDDHATILGLGLASVLNIPIVSDGRAVGTMNLLHQADWYTDEDEATGLVLAAFLLPVLLAR
jgi:GAF domain-containing protein